MSKVIYRPNHYQNAKDLFHRTRKILKKNCPDPQKASDNQQSIKEKNKVGDITLPDIIIYCKATAIKLA